MGKHQRGVHPLGDLRCKDCGAVWSPACETSPAVRRFPSTADDPVPIPKLTEAQLQEEFLTYFSICNRCGRTHRAKLYQPKSKDRLRSVMDRLKAKSSSQPEQSLICFGDIRCHCGASQNQNWYRLSLRHDPKRRLGVSENGYFIAPLAE